ncbi:nucleotidyltransferase family protein [Zhihengliuella salsuginis]|uniref:Polymerase nucleotidyl transferase domain-containing protein n=1 Tax=Zhihengliuella salsuginis TaxID=578222 RepID=A0ABQ3GEL4_9MICC|nr:nucleotidyltransferase family protein [Zhihengliuella salsuginis]GHD03202.1 hypothetical protein GCM10008096_09200 [Zhihengliuella salsuginis]
MIPTPRTIALRQSLAENRAGVDALLLRYGATSPRLFGSVARGDARADSDVDLLVDLAPDMGNPLMRISGLGEELSQLLGTRVDVVTTDLLRTRVSLTARRDSIPL